MPSAGQTPTMVYPKKILANADDNKKVWDKDEFETE